MAELTPDAQKDAAETALGRMLDELLAAGVDGTTVCHAATSMALAMLPAYACREHLLLHLDLIIEQAEAAIEEASDLEPGRDVAVGRCDHH